MSEAEKIAYRRDARRGIDDECLQGGLQRIQNHFGKGAMRYWGEMADDGLRDRVKHSRMETLENLDVVLAMLADNIEEAGGHVYYARTAEDATDYCRRVAKKNEVSSVIKGKSMISAEIGLDAALEAEGIAVTETDLGEFVIQLAEDKPSHIIAPCIHLDRQRIGRLFQEKLDIPYSDEPPVLTQAARRALRKIMLEADMGITGCNFAVAETGKISLVSNEGNIRMSTTMPRIHLALMGIERTAATMSDHQGMLQLLTRGATLQKLSTYVSFVGGPRRPGDPDGPEEFHLVMIDNGRSRILADQEFREVLACIRCGACLNICPVYGKIGGHAYNSPYPGPIGAVVSPLLFGINRYADLCKGESLCGACLDVCPVKIDLPRLLLALRRKLAYGDPAWQTRKHKRTEAMVFRLWRALIASGPLYRLALRCAGILQKPFISETGMIKKMAGPASAWTRDRDLPPLASEPFSGRWKKKYRQAAAKGPSEVDNG